MANLLEVRHVSVSIRRPPADVYDFAAKPENMPKWAAGLAAGSFRSVNGEWMADGPAGKVKVRFSPKNELGILDHDVVLESGVTVTNPIRVVANGPGSEVTFTLFRQPNMTNEELERDAKQVETDLHALKRLLECD